MSNLTSMLESGVRRAGMPTYREPSSPSRVPASPAVPARSITGAELLATIGAPQREHVDQAAHFLESLPAPLYDAAHDPDGAVALLFALLTHVDDRPAVEARQNEILDMAGGASLRDRVRQLEPQVSELGDAARLPLLDLLLPSVRELSPDQAQTIVSTAESLVESDGRLDVFELALLHVLGRQLKAARAGRNYADSSGGIRKVEQLRDEIATIISAVTWRGADDYRAALLAFDAARSPLPREVSGISLQKREDASLRDVQSALERVRNASLPIRRVVLEACAAAVTHDGRVEVPEATLLRAVAEALDCPMPMLQGTGIRG